MQGFCASVVDTGKVDGITITDRKIRSGQRKILCIGIDTGEVHAVAAADRKIRFR